MATKLRSKSTESLKTGAGRQTAMVGCCSDLGFQVLFGSSLVQFGFQVLLMENTLQPESSSTAGRYTAEVSLRTRAQVTHWRWLRMVQSLEEIGRTRMAGIAGLFGVTLKKVANVHWLGGVVMLRLGRTCFVIPSLKELTANTCRSDKVL